MDQAEIVVDNVAQTAQVAQQGSVWDMFLYLVVVFGRYTLYQFEPSFVASTIYLESIFSVQPERSVIVAKVVFS